MKRYYLHRATPQDRWHVPTTRPVVGHEKIDLGETTYREAFAEMKRRNALIPKKRRADRPEGGKVGRPPVQGETANLLVYNIPVEHHRALEAAGNKSEIVRNLIAGWVEFSPAAGF